MKLQLETHYLDGHWWFDLGLHFSPTDFNPDYDWVFGLSLGVATLYLRW